MKHIYYSKPIHLSALYILFLLASFPTKAQFSEYVVTDDSTAVALKSIVREYTANLSVQYHNDNNYGYFTLFNNTTKSISAKIRITSSNLFVSDFRILNDTIYACGSHFTAPSTTKGIIFSIPVNSITTASAQFSVATIDSVAELTRMVVYKHPITQQVKIIAIGYSTKQETPYLYHFSKVVECNTSNGTSFQHRVRNAYNTNTTSERFFDIVETVDYIALAGGLTDTDVVVLRKQAKNCTNFFSGMIDTMYLYNIPIFAPLSAIHSCKLKSNNMAIAYLSTLSGNDFYTTVRQFNLSTMNMSQTFSYLIGTKSEPDDMIYCDLTDTLYILQAIEFSSGSSTTNVQAVTSTGISHPTLLSSKQYYRKGILFRSLAMSGANLVLYSGINTGFKDVSYTGLFTCFKQRLAPLKKNTSYAYTILTDTGTSVWYNPIVSATITPHSFHISTTCQIDSK